MAVARVQFIAGHNGVGGTFQLTLPAAVTVGNLLYVVVGSFTKINATDINWLVQGSVTSGVFSSGEPVTQTSNNKSVTATLVGTVTGTNPMTIASLIGEDDASLPWVGSTSGAVYTPTSNATAIYAGTLAVGGNWDNAPDIYDNNGDYYQALDDRFFSRAQRCTVFVLPVVAKAGVQIVTIDAAGPAIAWVIEYSGLAGVLDVAATSQVNNGTTWQAPALTTSGTGMILTYAGVPFVQPATIVAGGGYTLLSEVDNAAAVCCAGVTEQLNTAAATYNPGGTVAAVNEVGAMAIAYK